MDTLGLARLIIRAICIPALTEAMGQVANIPATPGNIHLRDLHETTNLPIMKNVNKRIKLCRFISTNARL